MHLYKLLALIDFAPMEKVHRSLMVDFMHIFNRTFPDLGAIDTTTIFLGPDDHVPKIDHKKGTECIPRLLIIYRATDTGFSCQLSLANKDYIHNPEPEYFPFANLESATSNPSALIFESKFTYNREFNTLDLDRAGVNSAFQGRDTLRQTIALMLRTFKQTFGIEGFRTEAVHIATLRAMIGSDANKYTDYFADNGYQFNWKSSPLCKDKKGPLRKSDEREDVLTDTYQLSVAQHPEDPKYLQLIIYVFDTHNYLKNLEKAVVAKRKSCDQKLKSGTKLCPAPRTENPRGSKRKKESK